MPKSRGRKNNSGKRRGPTPSATRGPYPAPPVAKLVRTIMSGADLVGEKDPFIAELWASQMLGTFYKVPLPLEVQLEFERSMEAGLGEAIAEAKGEAQLAVLYAIAAVAPDRLGSEARARAVELTDLGVPTPPWAEQIGKPEFLDSWMTTDPYGDQRGYFARFRYEGYEPHTLMALFDVNLGGIVRDAMAAYTKRDLRTVEVPEGAPVEDVEPGVMATEILTGIATGDMYLDNAWTDEFKKNRALVAARMRQLTDVVPEVPSDFDPLPEESRSALIAEFEASEHATGLEGEDWILDQAIVYRCDYFDGDPLRWSPIGVELFMLDFVPRKVTLDANQIRNLPAVLKAWVRFALEKRGLEDRWIKDTEKAVDHWTKEFRKEVTDPDNFGMAKAMGQEMMAAGIDLTDQKAVAKWIEEFNQRPFEERDEFLRDR